MKSNINQWIVGTGFSRGIGYEIANQFKKNGFQIFHIGRTPGKFDDDFLQCDLSNALAKDFIFELQNILKSRQIHGFVYCAGIIPTLVSSDDPAKKVEFWSSQQKAMQINYFSCAELSEIVLPFLTKKYDSQYKFSATPFLAHISSLAAVDPLPNFELYGITKQACLNYFNELSKQYESKDLACLSIHPGTVQTDMLDQLLQHPEYKSLPVIEVLKNEMNANNIINAMQAAVSIVKFLIDESMQEFRILAHGKLYAADSRQVM